MTNDVRVITMVVLLLEDVDEAGRAPLLLVGKAIVLELGKGNGPADELM